MSKVTFDCPMTLPSCANLREHWTARSARAKDHRQRGSMYTAGYCRNYVELPLKIGQRATVTLTRIAPRRLDSDNVASAFKAFRDGVADALGIDDGSPMIEWRYSQEKGATRVKVVIEVREGSAE
jgi:crossover junction endodeoxyribonuclease RusA